MKTSYFANRSASQDPSAVSIARFPPRWWGSNGRYIKLAPSSDLLRRSRAGLPWEAYCEEYCRDVLDKLDPAQVWADLSESILLCWEAPGQECHRRLVAKWLEDALGVTIPEM